VILEQKVRAEPGTEILKLAQSDPSQDGIRKIVAELIPDDTTLLPSEQSAFLSGEAREKVLLLNGDDQDGRFLEEVLRRQAYQLDSSRAHSGSPEFGKLQEYSSVILNNVSMRQLSEQAVASLKRFVESGGGLVVSGGPQSYGLGGYQNTALEDLLPVRSVPPKAEERRLNVAVQLVIDKSQSMGTSQRLEFAKEASREVIKSLKDEDFIGVIGFDETPYEVLRMMSVAGNRDHAIERVGRLFPKGGTWLLPALREGKRRLEATPAGRKHMIIVTDGQLRDAGPVYLEDVRQARMLGITVSTVLIGGEMDFGFLRSLSEAGGGRYYTANDPSQLPRIFIQDVGIRSGEKTIKESEEFAVRLGVGELRSTSVRSFPPLRGFVETRIRPEANFELAVASGVELYPLLASWNFGKGKVAAFASDNNGRWSALWVPGGRFAEFWTSLVDSTRATSEERAKNIKFDLRHYVTRDALTLDVAVYDDIEPATLLADLVLPDSTSREARFERVSRGRYQLTLSEADAGTYRVALKTSGPAPLGRFTPVGFDVSGELFGERRGLGYNIALLEQLARTTGGRINPGAEDLATLAATRKEITDLRPYLLSLALIFFLLEIVRRELGFRLAISPQRAQSSPR
jgi:uncharacterized membrane protein